MIMPFAVVMTYAHLPSASQTHGRSERLVHLVYELLDAHFDTERLVGENAMEYEWRAHLAYLRDLQRVGREVLAEHIEL